jgi:hypothetical protein
MLPSHDCVFFMVVGRGSLNGQRFVAIAIDQVRRISSHALELEFASSCSIQPFDKIVADCAFDFLL